MFKKKEIRCSLYISEARTKAPILGLAVIGSRVRIEEIFFHRGAAMESGTQGMVLTTESLVS